MTSSALTHKGYAYQASPYSSRTLLVNAGFQIEERKCADLSHQIVDPVILVDDGSKDETARIAKELGLELFVHDKNRSGLRRQRQFESLGRRYSTGPETPSGQAPVKR